jgi:hypothetical protein
MHEAAESDYCHWLYTKISIRKPKPRDKPEILQTFTKQNHVRKEIFIIEKWQDLGKNCLDSSSIL